MAGMEIVFICTANRIRSPTAEAVARRHAAALALPLEVSSAGLMDAPSEPAMEHAVRAAAGLGLDLSQHSSRCISAVDLSGADLVIGFERIHVSTAVVDGNAPADKTFGLAELVKLLREPSVAMERGPEGRIAAAAARRNSGSFEPFTEIADPVGGPPSGYTKAARVISDLVTEMLERLFA